MRKALHLEEESGAKIERAITKKNQWKILGHKPNINKPLVLGCCKQRKEMQVLFWDTLMGWLHQQYGGQVSCFAWQWGPCPAQWVELSGQIGRYSEDSNTLGSCRKYDHWGKAEGIEVGTRPVSLAMINTITECFQKRWVCMWEPPGMVIYIDLDRIILGFFQCCVLRLSCIIADTWLGL